MNRQQLVELDLVAQDLAKRLAELEATKHLSISDNVLDAADRFEELARTKRAELLAAITTAQLSAQRIAPDMPAFFLGWTLASFASSHAGRLALEQAKTIPAPQTFD